MDAVLFDQAMLHWFPPASDTELSTRVDFTESDLRDISDLLHRAGKESWSRTPRIYVVLRLIDELGVMDPFTGCGVTDMSFPFSQRTLPGVLKDQPARERFLIVQSKVLTKALDLEKENSKHHHFSNKDDIPFKKVAELGRGTYGSVDKVLSTISYREYARKLIPRSRTFRQDRDLLRDFESELHALKKSSHRHIVKLVGSYTDP